MSEDGFTPGQRYRVRHPSGAVWMETANASQAHAEAANKSLLLERVWERAEIEWRAIQPDPAQVRAWAEQRNAPDL